MLKKQTINQHVGSSLNFIYLINPTNYSQNVNQVLEHYQRANNKWNNNHIKNKTGGGPLQSFKRISNRIGVDENSSLIDNGSQAFNMCGYRAPKLETVRIGFVGLGNRGSAAVPRINYIDGISINGLCDIRPERVQMAKKNIKDSPYKPKSYSGTEEDYKKMCESDDIDV